MKAISDMTAIASILLSVAGTAHAALFDRGNGMIYDSSLNVTWLQDANYAQISGYSVTGLMTWDQATTWAASLSYGGYSDWRLASARLNGNDALSYDGSTDIGWGNTRSEIGHLFFELGNNGIRNAAGDVQPSLGWASTAFIDATSGMNTTFENVKSYMYWEVEPFVNHPGSNQALQAYGFYVDLGAQTTFGRENLGHTWAVRDGDVVAVPLPAAAYLLGYGVIGLAGLSRKRKRIN